MAGVEILAIWIAVSFIFIFLGYASKNKIFAFAGGSFMLVLSLILLGFGYDVQTGQSLTTDYTEGYSECNQTCTLTQTNQSATNIYTTMKDNYTYAFGTLFLIMSLFIMLEIGRGTL